MVQDYSVLLLNVTDHSSYLYYFAASGPQVCRLSDQIAVGKWTKTQQRDLSHKSIGHTVFSTCLAHTHSPTPALPYPLSVDLDPMYLCSSFVSFLCQVLFCHIVSICTCFYRHVGLVVKAERGRPGVRFQLSLWGSSHTRTLKLGTPMATLSGDWLTRCQYTVTG